MVEPNNRASIDDIKNDEWFMHGHQGNLSNSFSSSESENEISDSVNNMAINGTSPGTVIGSPSEWKRR